MEPRADLEHVIQLVGTRQSEVEALYKIHGRNPEVYYVGLAADVDGLREAVLGNARRIFSYALRELKYQIDNYSQRA